MRDSTGLRTKDATSENAALSPQSLRAFLARVTVAGDLRTIAEPVDLQFEIAACLAEADGGPALRFDAVRGQRMPIVGNVLTSLPRIASGLRTTPAQLQTAIVSAIEHPLEHRITATAPCQEHVVKAPLLDGELPIPRFFEYERGSYITAGAIVAKDRLTGRANLSIARVMPLGGNRAFVGIAPNHHLAVLARMAHARGETLDIAVTVGNHPAVLIAACLYLSLGEDELNVAGALFGEPAEVVRCLNSDLLVPAHCECVLEGTLDAGEFVDEGPVSEFHGMYEDYGKGIVATFSHLTRRRDALFQVILPGYHREHCLIGGVAIAAGLKHTIRAGVPSVHEVAVGLGGAGRLHAVIALREPRVGEARKAMFAAWAAVNLIKQVIVIDGDVDPWDPVAVEWALATHTQPHRDYVIVPDVRADRSEPLEKDGTITKLGIDATRRLGDRPDWRRARPTEAALARARDLLRTHSISPQSNEPNPRPY